MRSSRTETTSFAPPRRIAPAGAYGRSGQARFVRPGHPVAAAGEVEGPDGVGRVMVELDAELLDEGSRGRPPGLILVDC